MSGKQKITRLVTFLGLNKYKPTEYEFLGNRATQTPYVCRALAELLHPSEITVLATQEAERDHGEGLKDALRAANYPAPRFVPIPLGRKTSELWQQFDVMKKELRGCNGTIMLDITHGLRSQPFFASAVSTFLHAVDEKPPDLRVCYAAYDARGSDGVAPIWELSEFVTLLDWARALAMFLKTGRAEEAGKATERLGHALAANWVEHGKKGKKPSLQELGKALRKFGADMETLRTGDLLIGRSGTRPSAAYLLQQVQEAREHVEQYLPPLADVLDRIEEMVRPLTVAHHDLSGPNGRAAVIALAELYLRLGRYLEAVATVREGWVNLYATEKALVPGAEKFNNKERERAEERAWCCDPDYKNVVLDRRNDLLHAQYRNSAQDAAGVIKTVGNLLEKLKSASEKSCDACLASTSDHSRGSCFVNLSNHPQAQWDNAQKKAALDFAPRIEDIAFPDVSPEMDEQAIEKLADAYAAKIPPEASHALIQGEFTLTMALVRRLQERGVICLAATSKREVAEDDQGRRVSKFRFVRFRAYPELRCRTNNPAAEADASR
jgi:CRISPR-associated protein Csx16